MSTPTAPQAQTLASEQFWPLIKSIRRHSIWPGEEQRHSTPNYAVWAMMNDIDDLQATIDRQAQRIAEMEQAARALYAALERRQECEECHGSGTVPWINYSEDDVSLEPCLCWSDAEVVLAEYSEWIGEGTDGD